MNRVYYCFMYFGTKPYDLEGYIRHHGDGSNMFRGKDFAQPRTLRDGDILSNGWRVVGEPEQGFNDSGLITFSNGLSRVIAPRLPLQLMSGGRGVLPGELRIGQILQTGCVILDTPKPLGSVERHDGQDEVEIDITGGWEGHTVGVPSDIELAVFEEEYPPSSGTPLGAFALERTLGMREVARRNLPELGQLTMEV